MHIYIYIYTICIYTHIYILIYIIYTEILLIHTTLIIQSATKNIYPSKMIEDTQVLHQSGPEEFPKGAGTDRWLRCFSASWLARKSNVHMTMKHRDTSIFLYREREIYIYIYTRNYISEYIHISGYVGLREISWIFQGKIGGFDQNQVPTHRLQLELARASNSSRALTNRIQIPSSSSMKVSFRCHSCIGFSSSLTNLGTPFLCFEKRSGMPSIAISFILHLEPLRRLSKSPSLGCWAAVRYWALWIWRLRIPRFGLKPPRQDARWVFSHWKV